LQVATTMAGGEDPKAQRVALQWFHTVNALFLHWAEATLLYADSGLRYYPNDAVLYLYRGTVHQMYANGRVQQFLNRADANAGYPQEPASVELARAATDLRRALDLDPTLVEARIRLAHVVGDLGRPDDAVALATEALRAKLPPFFESYASLILGRNQFRAGRLDDSRAAFERAAALAPTAQAPRIGRSQVALASGRPAEALAVLTDFLGPERSVDADEEVWERYYRVHDPEATEQLAALRAEVR
jgi:tetratricopeptide (TPR) repeat protein